MSAGVIIAGGGLAAQRCAEALRQGGYEAPVRIVSAEPVAPYDRPPLSKEFLAGERDAHELALRPQGWHAERDVELVLGDPAAGLDAERRRLLLASGSALRYEHLVIATGSRPRPLPGTEPYANVHVLRTLDDAGRLREALTPGVRLAVLGAGLIGQEVAATARGRGAVVTLVEAEPLPLARALHPQLATWLVGVQREEGVEVLLGSRVAGLIGTGDRLEALRLQDGGRVELDMLLVAIGVQAVTDWLPAPLAQLLARPEIQAAGDVAGGDHWELAAHQGRAAAHAILGRTPAATPLTSWWSDVHGVRIQGLGDPAGADAVKLDGDPAARSFTAVVLRAGRPVAALAAARPRELPRLRTLLTPSADPVRKAA
ncbi:MAG TPA: FAD-dependent oxidoreductase [Solirubrobacteraceae bacterium]|nr:FAD-dependent oxidoreductase [Solirubrobacteraceae bacterium]